MKRFINQLRLKQILIATMVPVSVLLVGISGFLVTRVAEQQVEKNTYVNVSAILNQTQFYLDTHMYNVFESFTELENNSSLYILKSQVEKNKGINQTATSYVTLNNTINQMVSYSGGTIENIYINFNDGKMMIQAYDKDPLRMSFSYQEWKEHFPENRYYWYPVTDGEAEIGNREVGMLLFHLYESPSENLRGIVMITLKETFFQNILNNPEISKSGFLCLLSENGDKIFADEDMPYYITLEEKQEILNLNEKSAVNSFADKLVFSEMLESIPWRLAAVVPKTEIFQYVEQIKKTSYLLMAAAMLGMIIISVWIAKLISNPLSELTEKVKGIENNHLDESFDINLYEEINVLNRGLEKMRLHIIKLLEQVKEEQVLKRKAEMSVLQAQIKPHFLYNTLYAVKQLCDLKEMEQASSMLFALASFYRIGISGGKSMITVAEEIEHVKSYLQIQQMRYSDDFDYIIDCDFDIMDCNIPKLSLQPLVENAIYHGVKLKRDKGYICIIGGVEGTDAFLEVHDNGPGLTKERLTEMKKALSARSEKSAMTSIGLRNVNDRIKIHFGERYGVTIESTENEDTTVRITFSINGGR